MNRDQIDNSRLAGLFDMPNDTKPVRESTVRGQTVNLDEPVGPSILAGILDVNASEIYRYRQNGMLPPNSNATLRDNLKHLIVWLRKKAFNKLNSTTERMQHQKIKLDMAKTEQTWIAVKQARGELVDVKVLAETFEPVFLNMRMQIVAIMRKHPEIRSELESVMNGWEELGKRTLLKAQEEFDNFIQSKMDEELIIEDMDFEVAGTEDSEEEGDF